MSAIISYSNGSKSLHWLIAVIVILLLSVSFFLADLPEHYRPTAYMIHKSFGLMVLFLMLVRLFWIWHTGKPALPEEIPAWQKALSHLVQYCFYILLIVMPLSGWILSVAAKRIPSFFNLFTMPLPIEPNEALATLMQQTHKAIAWVLIGLLILHVAAALKHHYINKDNVLKRMLF